MTVAPWMRDCAAAFEGHLDALLPVAGSTRHVLPQAMRHAVLGGGKRLRPLLVVAAADLVDAPAPRVRAAGCAVELIHAYSLVHDDMPCMDDDDLRRGRPTVHKAYGEAMALLAGDALQTLAFESLAAQLTLTPGPADVALLLELARAAGHQGMCGGQALDLHSVGMRIDRETLESMHRQKTGALLAASVQLGVLAGRSPPEPMIDLACRRYGGAIGLAFQVVDDILDETGDAATLGKTPGKDRAQAKPTCVSLLGMDGARKLADRLRNEALGALAPLGDRATRLRELADSVVFRHC